MPKTIPIEHRLLTIRGLRVILDADLAALYGVSTKRLNEQVKRNADRFPEDFAFQLTAEECEILRSQFATSKVSDSEDHAHLKSQIATSSANSGGRRYRPFAFTEHGAIQAANVLHSPSAIQMGVAVVRAFVRLRQVLADHKALAARLDELDARISEHDHQLSDIVAAIRGLLANPEPNHGRKIGFHGGNR